MPQGCGRLMLLHSTYRRFMTFLVLVLWPALRDNIYQPPKHSTGPALL